MLLLPQALEISKIQEKLSLLTLIIEASELEKYVNPPTLCSG